MIVKALARRGGRRVLLAIGLCALAGATSGGGAVTASAQAPGGTFVRTCAEPPPGEWACFALHRTTNVLAAIPAGQSAAAAVNGYGPSSIDSAYNVPTSLGAGRTVAIVDAYDDPNAESDLATYRSQFGLPACTTANGCFRKINQNGGTSPLPAPDGRGRLGGRRPGDRRRRL
jgi:hypothetical protein